MNEPTQLIAGTTVTWSFNHPLAEAQNQFIYAFRGPGVIDIAAVVRDGTVTVSESAAVTQHWQAGEYAWFLYVIASGDKQLIARGQLTIEPDYLALPAGHDARSTAEKILAAIDKALENQVLANHERYTIEGRSLDRIPTVELVKLRAVYAAKVRREKRKRGFGVKRILLRFPG